MSIVSPLSPVTLPWTALRLAGRFALPLALWFTAGELVNYGLLYVGYRLGKVHDAFPVMVLSITVMAALIVTVGMMHVVRGGLTAIGKRHADASLAPWAAREQEPIMDALGRALLPFMIFYLAWGMYARDARRFLQGTAERGAAESGIQGETEALKVFWALDSRVYLALALTAGFFAVKAAMEVLLRSRSLPYGGILIAYLEVNWVLFGIFTIQKGLDWSFDWITGRVFWAELNSIQLFDVSFEVWPFFKAAILGALIWLVIAGVLLGVDAQDEKGVMGQGRVMTRVATASGLDKPHSPHEVMTREIREKWVPAIFGFRLVFRAGVLPFAVFCVLFAGADVVDDLLRRWVYLIAGPHEVTWWIPRAPIVDFFASMVSQAIKICLLAATFDQIIARVSARSSERAGGGARLSASRTPTSR